MLPGFADRSAEEREIESLTNDITRVGVSGLTRDLALPLTLSFQMVITIRIFGNAKTSFRKLSTHLTRFPHLPAVHHETKRSLLRMCKRPSLQMFKILAAPSEKSNAYTCKVRPHTTRPYMSCSCEFGHPTTCSTLAIIFSYRASGSCY